ncbi:hypothetical protein KUH32_13420 [Thalassococcus sp. CAU 1522]|uniref:Uncharacterized protein n=1 Tax=Thalassococcus arenae TaxID=2851652 RepID=A0ABS6NB68_9RHOB|nr:DUF6639 family protein [Thalassococcus arenae]MBV2360780.1 hypothetical protein [Thalassococcus arenae]
MRRLLALSFAGMAGAVMAQPQACDNGIVTAVADDPALRTAICTASDRGLSVLRDCGLRQPETLTIAAVAQVDTPCLGLFHCGEQFVEVLTPGAMSELRDSEGLFAHLPVERLFDSVVAHELAHSTMDGAPCPFDNCIASQEYFAYAVQIASLTETERAPIEARLEPDQKVSRDNINAMILFMAPHRFGAYTWVHLTQRDGMCAYLGRVQSGDLVFDRPHP